MFFVQAFEKRRRHLTQRADRVRCQIGYIDQHAASYSLRGHGFPLAIYQVCTRRERPFQITQPVSAE